MKVIIAPEAEAHLPRPQALVAGASDQGTGAVRSRAGAGDRSIGEMPESFPVYSERSGRIVRRCLLRKASCHLYFEVLPAAGEVWILAVHGAVQRRAPRLPAR
jgi:hypothetical protein